MSDRRTSEKGEGYRSPPHNLEAEQALLGALLVNNEALHLVATFLEPDHFFLPVHGRIYAAVMHMVGRQETANPVTLKTYFANDEALKEAGGQYLARLAGSAVTVINAGHYGRAVHDLYLRRQLIFLAEELDIPVLLLSQLNRAGERGDNKVSKLSDLRDSGSIEQDVDSILFLYRKFNIWQRMDQMKTTRLSANNGTI